MHGEAYITIKEICKEYEENKNEMILQKKEDDIYYFFYKNIKKELSLKYLCSKYCIPNVIIYSLTENKIKFLFYLFVYQCIVYDFIEHTSFISLLTLYGRVLFDKNTLKFIKNEKLNFYSDNLRRGSDKNKFKFKTINRKFYKHIQKIESIYSKGFKLANKLVTVRCILSFLETIYNKKFLCLRKENVDSFYFVCSDYLNHNKIIQYINREFSKNKKEIYNALVTETNKYIFLICELKGETRIYISNKKDDIKKLTFNGNADCIEINKYTNDIIINGIRYNLKGEQFPISLFEIYSVILEKNDNKYLVNSILPFQEIMIKDITALLPKKYFYILFDKFICLKKDKEYYVLPIIESFIKEEKIYNRKYVYKKIINNFDYYLKLTKAYVLEKNV